MSDRLHGSRWQRLVWLLPVVAVLIGLVAYSPAAARTYFVDLPDGVLSVSLDDGSSIETTNEDGPPVIDDNTPTFSGQMEAGTTAIEVVIQSVIVRYLVPVDPDTGRWTLTANSRLEDGEHSLYINDALVGTFVVETGADPAPTTEPDDDESPAGETQPDDGQPQAPAPANTGTGGLLGIDAGTGAMAQGALVLAMVVLTGAGTYAVRRSRRLDG